MNKEQRKEVTALPVKSEEKRENRSAIVRAHIGTLLTNLFFAGNYSLVKAISPSLIEPYGVNVLRAAISAALFWLIWLFGKTGAGIRRKDWPRFFFCALTGIALNQTLFIKGLTLTSTIHAALLILVTPIVVTLFALWILKERFTLAKALGLGFGIGGATFLILQREAGQHATNYLLGDVLIVLNAIAYSVYFILVKPLMQEYSTLHVTRWVFTIGLFLVLPFGWSQTAAVEWSRFGWQQFLAVFYVAVVGTFLAYYFTAYALRKLGASVTGAYIYTQPVFAVVIAIIFLDEKITWQKIISALLIFIGVFLVNLKRKEGQPRSHKGTGFHQEPL